MPLQSPKSSSETSIEGYAASTLWELQSPKGSSETQVVAVERLEVVASKPQEFVWNQSKRPMDQRGFASNPQGFV